MGSTARMSDEQNKPFIDYLGEWWPASEAGRSCANPSGFSPTERCPFTLERVLLDEAQPSMQKATSALDCKFIWSSLP